MEEKVLTVNGKAFTVLRLLGKGKGGYSYLVSGGAGEAVVKQIHHEPCAYYQFGDKLQAELHDYRRHPPAGVAGCGCLSGAYFEGVHRRRYCF